MDDELRNLHEAMVMKERLRVLAELQATYLQDLVDRGIDNGIAEQLLLDWSRQAFGQTFRAIPEQSLEESLDTLLDDATADIAPASAAPAAPPESLLDSPRVPFGEGWLQLVDDLDDDAGSGDAADERAA